MRIAVITVAYLILSASISAQQGQTTPAISSGKAVLEAYVSAWNRHDFAALDKVLAPDAVHEDIAQGVHAQGLGEIKKFMRKEIESEPDLDWRLTSIVEAGAVVAAEWTWSGTFTGEGPTGPVKGRRISGRGASVVVTKSGQIKRFTDYYDLASFLPKPSNANAASTEDTILELEKRGWQAAVDRDSKADAALLADDFQNIAEYGVWNKTQFAQTVTDPNYFLKAFSVADVRSSWLAPTVVLLTYKATQAGTYHGKPLPSPLYVSSVWVKRDGKWLNVLYQDTPEASDQPTDSANPAKD